LYATAGETRCEACGEAVARDTVKSAVDRLLELPPDTGLLVAFDTTPPGEGQDWRWALRQRGFHRVVVDGQAVDLEGMPAEPPETVTVLYDRLRVRPEARDRLAEAVQMAFREGGGSALVQVQGGPRLAFSEGFACRACGRPHLAPEPRLFSFNHAMGACPACRGFGNLASLDLARVVPDPGRSLAQDAIEPWRKPRHRKWKAGLRKLAARHEIGWRTPFRLLDPEQQRRVLEGDAAFPGVRGFFDRLESRKYRMGVRALLNHYRTYGVCPECDGRRLRREARLVEVGGKSIDQLLALSVAEADAHLGTLDDRAAAPLVAALRRRLSFLLDVGLGYLTLDRGTGTLSGGEGQRIGLASALGTGLRGTLYVLDEPSAGLHSRDTERLLRVLRRLRDIGNSVVVVEHDPDVVRAADYVVDLGPGAGEQGGRVVFSGTYPELLGDERGLTAKFLRGDLGLGAKPATRRRPGAALWIREARARNLKGIDVRIPLGGLTVVTGVSGSGKSTLLHEVICAGLAARRGGKRKAAGLAAIEGADAITEVEQIDQSPIGRTPRSNPVTYMKAFDPVRQLFAATPDARKRGLKAGHFSFNIPGGRCEACAGDGQVRVDMQFLADVALVCDACGGRRYKSSVLEVRYRGKTIDEALDLTVREALRHFGGEPRIAERLRALERIGLGYLRLGQPAATLSGGEAQRVKLAAHLVRRPGRQVLYVFDEPTTGLHPSDVRDLLGCFERLLEGGATVVVIEHNLEVARRADWVVDLGPEGGPGGGHLLFQGTPEAMVEEGEGPTAECLRALVRSLAERAAG
jgi:excinuclease ABC subunit A